MVIFEPIEVEVYIRNALFASTPSPFTHSHYEIVISAYCGVCVCVQSLLFPSYPQS